MREEAELGDVVEDDEGGEGDEADKGDLVDALLDLLVDVATHDGLDDEEEDHAAVEDGDGKEIEDAEVERDEGHGADKGHPSGHLNGLVDLGADADGAGERFDGDLAGEHAVEDLPDEEGGFFVELPGGFNGLRQGKALDLDGRLGGVEAELVVPGAVAGVSEDGCEGDGDGGAVAIDDEGDGFAGAVLEVGEQGGDGVEVEAVDGFDLVTGLDAGAGGGQGFFAGRG